MSREIEWLMEQMAAVEHVIHQYRCFSCQIATAQEAIIIIQPLEGNDLESGGCRVTVVGICDTCKNEKSPAGDG